MVSEETKDQEAEVSGETKDQGKCTRQFVLIAEMNVKFHSSHQETSLFIAETVLESISHFRFNS